MLKFLSQTQTIKTYCLAALLSFQGFSKALEFSQTPTASNEINQSSWQEHILRIRDYVKREGEISEYWVHHPFDTAFCDNDTLYKGTSRLRSFALSLSGNEDISIQVSEYQQEKAVELIHIAWNSEDRRGSVGVKGNNWVCLLSPKNICFLPKYSSVSLTTIEDVLPTVQNAIDS